MVIISHGPIFRYYNDYRRTCIENALSMLIALIALLAQAVSAVQQIALSFFNTCLTCFLGLQLTDQHGWLFKLQVCAFAHQHHASSYTWSKLQENHKQNLRSCEPQTFSDFFFGPGQHGSHYCQNAGLVLLSGKAWSEKCSGFFLTACHTCEGSWA